MNLTHKLLSSLIILFLFSSVADAARTNTRVRCREIDRLAPTTPTSVMLSTQTATQVTLTWTASTDNLGISGYYVFANGTRVATVNTPTVTITDVNPGELYLYTVQAFDDQNNVSSLSEAVSVQTGDTPIPDTTTPSTPSNLTATVASGTQIDLDWDASTDDVGVTGYKIYQDGLHLYTTTLTAYSMTGLSTADTNYTFSVEAYDDANNTSSPATVNYTFADTTAPTPPSNLSTTNTTTSITLSWTASTDAVGVTGYKVYKDDVLQTTTTELSYEFTSLTTNTAYDLSVEAIDAAANVSTRAIVTVGTGCSKTTIGMGSVVTDTGFAWKLVGDFGAAAPDTPNTSNSPLRLFEDDLELGPAHSFHSAIRNVGLGAFSHKADDEIGTGEALRWSASDNTNVTTNGRTYSYCVDADPAPPPEEPPVVSGAAFPGAMGGGAGADGGAGGSVIFVTNTNDSGTGSLRACIQATGARTCVFRTGGTISLASSLSVNNPFITVAGQTAPGGGIQIRCTSINGTCVSINTNNVVWQYTRVRHGYKSGALDAGSNIMAFGHDIIIDHNSTYWNLDEGIGSWGWVGSSDPYNITISNNIIAEGLTGHSTGTITGGGNALGQTDIDVVRNLYMNNSHRNPMLKNRRSRVVNNILYNNVFHGGQYMGGISVDNIGNKYIKGPLMDLYTRTTWDWHPIQIAPSPGSDSPNTDSNQTIPKIYVSGNISWYQADENSAVSGASGQWLHTVQVPGENGTEINTGPASTTYQRTTPLADTAFPITAIAASSLDTAIIPTIGASRKLDCAGNWVMNRDSTDTRLMTEYANKTGITAIPDTENSTVGGVAIGGFPTLSAGTACTDTDSDGMPDEYETAKGFNINSAADRNTVAANGYTNLQNYLAGI